MVEVFKTNVQGPAQAKMLIQQIHKYFRSYQTNFDLEDCDKILRVECPLGSIDSNMIIHFLKNSGFDSEVLADDVPSSMGMA